MELCLFIVIERKPIKARLRLGKLAGCCQYKSADIVCTLDTSALVLNDRNIGIRLISPRQSPDSFPAAVKHNARGDTAERITHVQWAFSETMVPIRKGPEVTNKEKATNCP